MHLVSRHDTQKGCVLKVLDLGVMICAEDGQELNDNLAVQAFRRCGDNEDRKRRYDWLPWEVRETVDGISPVVNFAVPPHSFDVFSVGVLILHLLVGKREARVILDNINQGGTTPDTMSLNLEPQIVLEMLGEASKRPHPKDILGSLCRNSLPNKARSRSRNREQKQRERRQRWQAVGNCNCNGNACPKQSEMGGSVGISSDTVGRIASHRSLSHGVLDDRKSMVHRPQPKQVWQAVPTTLQTDMPGSLQALRPKLYPALEQQTSASISPPSGAQPYAPPLQVPDVQNLHATQRAWYSMQNHVPPLFTRPFCPRNAMPQALFPLQLCALRGDPISLLSRALQVVVGANQNGSASGSNTAVSPPHQAAAHHQQQPTNADPCVTSWLSL